ncbi:MAG: bifunctional serine/threonine-protein kinase/formylglycine-generating enzyme family protein [Planctomycetota bacterium]|nr:bifunctional serine/threonine-protein kinase/formylglycine-generating enzyme family protein [Planctomycetota bacterium]
MAKSQTTVPDPEGAALPGPPSANPPPAIGGWSIVRLLGRGGIGSVYLAQRGGRRAALKLVPRAAAPDGDWVARFRRESQIMAQLRHPHLVELYEHGEEERWLWLAMEYIPGGDLASYVRRRGRLLEREACVLVQGCAAGLLALHERGLIHRDVKPENVFLVLVPQGPPLPKVGDLGMARCVSGADRMTLSGCAVGTPAYMAPEQVRGQTDLDARVDVYGLGATLFTLLAGRPPFAGDTPYVVAHAVLSEPTPDVRRYNPQVSAAMSALIAAAMAKERAARHPDLRAFLADLERVAQGLAPLHGSGAAPPRSDRPPASAALPAPRSVPADDGLPWAALLRLGVPAALLLALLTGLAWWVERAVEPPPVVAPAAPAPAASAAPPIAVQQDAYGPFVRLPLAETVCELRWCPPGEFVMGSPPDEPGRSATETPHRVRLTRGFWILAHEVSYAQFEALLPRGLDVDPALPVGDLSYEQCLAWLQRFNQLHPGLGARLPSEAEWEYACRAGSSGPFAIEAPPVVCRVPAILAAWERGGLFAAENAWLLDPDHPALRAQPVRSGALNAWGLAHMHGNVAEWCADRWDGETPYDGSARQDPLEQRGALQAIRGGSWLHPLAAARSAARAAQDPALGRPWLGFRFVVPGGTQPHWPPR